MIFLKKKDIKNRNLLLKKEIKNKSIKFVFNRFLGFRFRDNNDVNLSNSFFSKHARKISYKSRVVRRCILTNRGRGSQRMFLVSRICLRDLLLSGKYSGYKKAS